MTFASHRLALAAAGIALCSSSATRAQPAPPAAPTIAPADGGAPPEVKDATPAAGAAKPAPMIPRPPGAPQPAFRTYAEIDLPLLTLGLVFVSVRFVLTQRAFCAPQCDRRDLNSLDRTTAGYWSPGWAAASNVGVVAMGAGAVAVLTLDEGLAAALNDSVVVAESALSATAAATIMTIAAGRPRPFLYGDKAPLVERNGTDAGDSFLSSHAAVGFAIATSTFIAMRRLHPRSRLPYGVLGVGLGAAGFVATTRVLAGQHFVTDAVGGALVGSSIGVLIAAFHRSPATLVPLVGEAQAGLGVQGSF